MVNIIVIFTIVFVPYCEINADKHYLQNMETTTADFRNPITAEENDAGIEHLQRRVQIHSKETQANRYITGSREDISILYPDFEKSNSLSHNNYFFKPGVINSRRFDKIYYVEDSTQTDEFDNASIKPEKHKKHQNHSKNNMTKKHDSANNEEKEIHKKDEKDIKKNDSSSSSDMKLNTQKRRFKIKDREDKKKSKLPKAASTNHEREKDHIYKKKQVKEKSKDKKEEKSIDRSKAKGGIIKLTNTVTGHSSKNDKINKTKQFRGKRKHKQKMQSKEPLRNVKSSPASLPGPSKVTTKVTKLPQTTTKKLEKKLTTTKSPKTKPSPSSQKPNTKPTQKVTKETKKPVQRAPILRAAQKNHREPGKQRPTKMAALSLNNKKVKNLRQNELDASPSNGSPPSYLSPYAIMSQMELLMKEFPEANVSVTKSGRTVEYNDIVMVTIREQENQTANFRAHESKYIDDVPEKKIIFIVHGLTVMGLKHMTSLVELTQLKLLLSYYLKHLDKFDFILMPLANPDGYSASLASDRTIWNKNASPQAVCSGVFLDRNFDVSWNSSHEISSCSQLYPGSTPFSEEESKAVRDVLHHYSHKILAYIHVHAGSFDDKVFKGDAVLYPKGFTGAQSDDDKYIDIKGEVEEAMRNASFRVITVTVDTLANWYGLVHGTSVDYAATVYGIPYAMEFVMQIYDSAAGIDASLTEIWSRLIDTTFNNMWKNLQRGADTRRRHY